VSNLSEEAARLAAAIGERFGHDGPECRVCPVCQLLSRLDPEVVEHLTEAALQLALAFRAAAASGPRRDAPTVERIDIA
jgi:hypothetical protein